MSASSARLNLSKTLLVALFAALATSADAAVIALKKKDNEMMSSNITAAADVTITSVIEDDSYVYNPHVFNFTDVAHTTGITEMHDFTSGQNEGLCFVWYLTAFCGLLIFFFLIACGEMLIGTTIHKHRLVADLQRGLNVTETLPPPYHLFGPPTYDNTVEDGLRFSKDSKKITDVYVVPVHAAAASGPTAATDVKIYATV